MSHIRSLQGGRVGSHKTVIPWQVPSLQNLDLPSLFDATFYGDAF